MIKHEEKKNITITFSNAKTAYTYEGSVKLVFHNGAWIKTKNLTITFDKQEAQQHGNYKLACSDELMWWSCVDEVEIPALVECSDGLFRWIEPGYDIVESGLIKL